MSCNKSVYLSCIWTSGAVLLTMIMPMLSRNLGTGPDQNSSLHPHSGFFPAKSPVTISEDVNSEDNKEQGQSKA